VYLTHVMEPPSYVLPRLERLTYEGNYRDEAQRRLQTLADAMKRRLGDAADVRVELTSGPAEVQICNLADRVRAHLVIVGSHGRSGFSRALLGSVAERVARFAKRPVLIVPLAGTHRRGR
jgi:nucleotide-binding universal stress UspA family protein